MSYYRICPSCGSALDPGERCSDCAEKAAPPVCKTERAASLNKPLTLYHTKGDLSNVQFRMSGPR